MHEHWKSGHEDTKRTLMHHAWFDMPDNGIVVIWQWHPAAGSLSRT